MFFRERWIGKSSALFYREKPGWQAFYTGMMFGVKRQTQQFRVGDIVRMKKKHPCGSFEWEVLRTGVDVRIKCAGCGRMVLLPRIKFVRAMREVVGPAEQKDDR